MTVLYRTNCDYVYKIRAGYVHVSYPHQALGYRKCTYPRILKKHASKFFTN